jgi:hypothetical protein
LNERRKRSVNILVRTPPEWRFENVGFIVTIAGNALKGTVHCLFKRMNYLATTLCVFGVAPLLVDTDGVKRAVERQFTQSAGGEVAYESASLDLFPRPRVVFSGITVRVPGAVSGRIAALQVGVAWLPLLYGQVRPTVVRIERPVLEARIAPGAAPADPFAGYRAALGPIADALVRDAAGTSLAIDGGELAVAYGERRMVSLSGIEVAAEISAEAISATVSAAADSWRTAVAIRPPCRPITRRSRCSALHRRTSGCDCASSHTPCVPP